MNVHLHSIYIRRIFAFLIDWIILALIGLTFAMIAKDQLILWGNKSLLIGSVLACSYFTFFNSLFGHGQTFGKRYCHIKVVGSNRQEVSFGKSFLRSILYVVPILLSGNTSIPFFQNVIFTKLLSIIQWFLVIGIPCCQIYLYIYNRTTVHDLLLDTTVVDMNSSIENPRPIKPISKIFLICIIIATLASGTIYANKSFNKSSYTRIFPLIQDLKQTGKYTSVNVFENIVDNKNCLFVVVSLKQSDDSYNVYCEIISILAKRKDLMDIDQIDIRIDKGYNIGIIRWSDYPVNSRKSLNQWEYDLNEMRRLKGFQCTR